MILIYAHKNSSINIVGYLTNTEFKQTNLSSVEICIITRKRMWLSVAGFGNRQQVDVPPHHQRLREDVQRQLQIDVLGLLHPQDLADDHEHDGDVGGNAHVLVGAHHGDVDCDDGQLGQLVLDDFFQPDDGGSVGLLLDAFADDGGFVCIGRRDLFVVVLVVDGLVRPLLHHGSGLIGVLHLQVGLVLSLPLV